METKWKPEGFKDYEEAMKDVIAPYLAGEAGLEANDVEEPEGVMKEESEEEVIKLHITDGSDSSESEGALGSDDDDYNP